MKLRKVFAIVISAVLVLSQLSVDAFASELPSLNNEESSETSIASPSNATYEDSDNQSIASPSDAEYEYEDEDEEEIVITYDSADVSVRLSCSKAAFNNSGKLSLSVQRITNESIEDDVDEALDGIEKENVAKRVTYDIKVLDDGKEIEPVKKVNISFKLNDAPDGADGLNIFHHANNGTEMIASEEIGNNGAIAVASSKEGEKVENYETLTDEELEELEDIEIENDLVVNASTKSFSLYTIDFTYKDKTISIEGNTNANKLDDVVSQLGISSKVEEAHAYTNADKPENIVEGETESEVQNSNGNTLFKVYETNDIWYVDAVNAFDTEHGLVIRTEDGAEYKIKVTDASGTQLSSNGGKLASGDYYLNMDIPLNENIIIEQGSTVTIDLNNFTLSGNGNGSVIINKGNLTIKGPGTITNGKAAGDGGGIYSSGVLNLKGITITGNEANRGGGVFLDEGGSYTFDDVSVQGNISNKNGGGVFLQNGNPNTKSYEVKLDIQDTNKITKVLGAGLYEVGTLVTIKAIPESSATFKFWQDKNSSDQYTDNPYSFIMPNKDIHYEANGQCFIKGTKITMADGSYKNIEDVQDGDLIRTFDHETGKISSAKAIYKYHGETTEPAVMLHFDNGNELGIVGQHGLLEKSSLKYINVSYENAGQYIGHYFYNADENCWNKLISIIHTEEKYEYYALYSENHINCIANNMISVTDDALYKLNTFEFDENLLIDQVKKQKDIDKYGIITYEDFCRDYPKHAKHIEKDEYYAFRNQYVPIAVGKGLITMDEIMGLCDEFVTRIENNTAIVTSTQLLQNVSTRLLINKVTTLISTARPMIMSLLSTVGLTLKGKIIIKGNSTNGTDNNLYLCDGKTVTTDSLLSSSSVGVTTEKKPQNGSVVNVTDNNANFEGYFFSDSSNYETFANGNVSTGKVALRKKAEPEPVIEEKSTGNSAGNSSVFTPGWKYAGGKWQYIKANLGYAQNEWLLLEAYGEKKWYHFGNDKYMTTGWFCDIDGSWYYLSKEDGKFTGTMVTGWLIDPQDGYKYYLDPVTGKMLIGWNEVDKKKHYFTEGSIKASGWTKNEKGEWVYKKEDVVPLGAMVK